MYTRLIVFFTKLLVKLLRLLGKNASALPGLIVETLSPSFLHNVLRPVEHKIVLITGTNGKTTSTKMVVHALRAGGRRVVTNSTGSNMTRGLISAVITDMTLFGSLKETDWFVFEMDEAYAPKFAKGLKIHSLLGLNVLRDQLDRYGEIDATAELIKSAAVSADNFIYNATDSRLVAAAQQVAAQKVQTVSFGVVENITHKLRGEHNMYTNDESQQHLVDFQVAQVAQEGDLQHVTIKHKQEQIEVTIPILGFHNAVNVCGVVSLLSQLEPEDYKKMSVAIKTMDTPFGRGEKLHLSNKNITVALVKNPSGLTHNLETFVAGKTNEHILFVVNDQFADGRDVSWLWDVVFKDVVPSSTTILCSGIRAYDMAVRLKQDGLQTEVETDVSKAVARLMQSAAKNTTIIPTYTALYEVRAALAKYGKVPRIW